MTRLQKLQLRLNKNTKQKLLDLKIISKLEIKNVSKMKTILQSSFTIISKGKYIMADKFYIYNIIVGIFRNLRIRFR